MKNLITGIALATAAVTAFAEAPVGSVGRSMGSMGGMFGSFKLFLSLQGVWSKKDVKVTTDMTTKYNAGYAYAADGTRLLGGDWVRNDAAARAGAAMGDAARSWGIWLQDNNEGNALGVTKRYEILYAGTRDQWYASAVLGGGNVRPGQTAASVVNLNATILKHALFGGAAALPADKAYVAPADYSVTSQVEKTLDYHEWGIRVEAGAGYCILDELTLFILGSYTWTFDQDDTKNKATGVAFETKGAEQGFKAADGTTDLKGNLTLKSFGWADKNLAKDVTIQASVQETFGIMGGLEWRPAEMFAIFLKAGVKRYAIEVTYEGGEYAYPFTTSQYADTFLKTNEKYKMWISQDKKSRTLKTTEWPFAFGGGLRVVFMGMHCINFGIEYATFDSEVTGESEDKDSDKDNKKTSESAELELANPFSAAPSVYTHVQQAGTGTHQFAPTGKVINTVSTKLDVSDLTITLGYMLTL